MSREFTFRLPAAAIALVVLLLLPTSKASGFGSEIGKITAIKGAPVIIRGDKTILPKINTRVKRGDTVKTRFYQRISITFDDDSIMNLGENTEVELNEFVYSRARKERSNRFNMLRGKLRLIVSKLKTARKAQFKVDTPTAIIGIRGSDFIITVEKKSEGNTASAYPLYASLDSPPPANLSAQFEGWMTKVFCLDGSGYFQGLSGEVYFDLSAGLMGYFGPDGSPVIMDIPPEVMNQLLEETGGQGGQNDLGTAGNPCQETGPDGQVVNLPDGTQVGECQECRGGQVSNLSDGTALGECRECRGGEATNKPDGISVGVCSKCQGGEVVPDDMSDPGMCQKCEGGEVTPDNDEDPGMCQKCQGGSAVNDNTEDPGMCMKCEGGNAVPDNDENPGTCLKCSAGVVDYDDNEVPGECQKCEAGQVVDNPGAPCDDGDPCTKNDRCVGNTCEGTPMTSRENPNCQ